MILFTVEGKGLFPFDMLCTAEAWPATTGDVKMLGHLTDSDEPRQINFKTHLRPTQKIINRWNAFGWTIYPATKAEKSTPDPDLSSVARHLKETERA